MNTTMVILDNRRGQFFRSMRKEPNIHDNCGYAYDRPEFLIENNNLAKGFYSLQTLNGINSLVATLATEIRAYCFNDSWLIYFIFEFRAFNVDYIYKYWAKESLISR